MENDTPDHVGGIDMDHVRAFIGDMIQKDPRSRVKASEIHEAWHHWTDSRAQDDSEENTLQDVYRGTGTGFGMALVRAGLRKVRLGTGNYYVGVRLTKGE